MVWTSDSRGHLAKSLQVLLRQVDEKWPSRSREDDGTIGDAAHQATKSDHNPLNGVVYALDLTHDPKNGFDSYQFAEALVRARDPRLQYVISNGRIANADVEDWKWRPFTGKNPHDKHVHISARHNGGDSEGPWAITSAPDAPAGGATYQPLPRLHLGSRGEWVTVAQKALKIEADGIFGYATDVAVRAFQKANSLRVDGWIGPATWSKLGIHAATTSKTQLQIIATRFGGKSDPNYSAYDGHFIDDDELGVALPFRFYTRPLVWVSRDSTRLRNIPIVDVGPIYPAEGRGPEDPYWETEQRPRAERLGILSKAGIDLTPALASRLGITAESGKGLVNWGFEVEDNKVPEPTAGTPPAEPEAQSDWTLVGQTILSAILLPWLKARLSNQPTPQFKLEDLKPLIGPALHILLSIMSQPQEQKTQPPKLSSIDHLLGGEALVGKKTATGIAALLTSIGLQLGGAIPPISDGNPWTILATLFPAGLTLLGLVAKIDRRNSETPK